MELINNLNFKTKNMENVIWGEVPAQRKRKEERFSTPVMTMSAIDKPGAGRKFSFNNAAQTALEIVGEDIISFGFDTNSKKIFVKKTDTGGFKLTKTCTLSDKKTYEFIARLLDLNIETENHFDLVEVEGRGYFELCYMIEDAAEVFDTISEETIAIAEDVVLNNEAEVEVVEILEERTTEETLGETEEGELW